ncbi:homing endonuclease associated repeat-containing protein [Halorhabdus sp. CUG00001]|uniref:homing endonuclease associated repeat-containing protein n=1 Tax=Halorhabdus sp. CUG00001 TaxID=2600297 RepID=UPI001E2D110A|nr:hypothetical protein [Halorhabdus sp. CUG00001]
MPISASAANGPPFITDDEHSKGVATEHDCIEALRDAAAELGESPTKAQYEALGMTPAASTILRVVGGWNEAKRRAGLGTSPSTGTRVAPKPDEVDLPENLAWTELTQDQRWHYKHVDRNTQRTLQRRHRLRAWVNDRKAQRGCRNCGESNPACLDFHHSNDDKEMAITDMITHGYSIDRLKDEIATCEVLCANCHQKQHDRRPAVVRDETASPTTKRERLQVWTFAYRRQAGCQRCHETDPVCLQFHHETPETKTDSIGNLIANSAPEAAVRGEVEKCIVLCASCHRKEHRESPVEIGPDT